jgi:SAM-dependent methyltransferase
VRRTVRRSLGLARRRLRAALRRQPSSPEAGTGLRPGAKQYRAYVGPPEDYDLLGGLQFGLLLAAGLRERHVVADVGCGSLRAGKLLIPYLAPGNYVGLEPNRWLVEEGISRELGREIVRMRRPRFFHVDDFGLERAGVAFDYVIAQSIFSHTYPQMFSDGLKRILPTLAPEGVLLATYFEGEGPGDGTGWLYPDCVPFVWDQVRDVVEGAGGRAAPIEWPHPRQRWFVAGRPEAIHRVLDLSARIRPPTG